MLFHYQLSFTVVLHQAFTALNYFLWNHLQLSYNLLFQLNVLDLLFVESDQIFLL